MQKQSVIKTRRRWSGLAFLVLGLLWAPLATAGYRSMVVTVTAYNSVPDQTDSHPMTGAWKDKMHPGMHEVAVSRDLISKGLTHHTKLAIQGFNHNFVVWDKMADDVKQTVDIYMGKNVEKARKFGRKQLRIWWYTSN